jgi:hypothetical protein
MIQQIINISIPASLDESEATGCEAPLKLAAVLL